MIAKSSRIVLRGLLLITLVFLLLANIPATAQSNCYPHDTAYIAGNMNIRESATTASRVVVTARLGDSFSVISSELGETWCWLEIDKGWIANTSRVVSTKPTYKAPQASEAQQPVQQHTNIDNCCYVNRQCNSDQEWADGYWAYQRNECPVTSQPVSATQTQDFPPTRGEGGNLPPITASSTFYEFLAEGEYTTGMVPLSQGTWDLLVTTAATTLAFAESPGDRCFRSWRGDRILVASKSHNILGANNYANGQFTVTKDCNVRFYVWAPRHRWSLKLTKIG